MDMLPDTCTQTIAKNLCVKDKGGWYTTNKSMRDFGEVDLKLRKPRYIGPVMRVVVDPWMRKVEGLDFIQNVAWSDYMKTFGLGWGPLWAMMKTTNKSFSEGYRGFYDYTATTRVCTVCKKTKGLDEFYDRTNRRNQKHPHCEACQIKACHHFNNKSLVIEYKGSCCEICNNSSLVATAYELHHKDPSKKEFGLSTVRNLKSLDKLKGEIDKCCTYMMLHF